MYIHTYHNIQYYSIVIKATISELLTFALCHSLTCDDDDGDVSIPYPCLCPCSCDDGGDGDDDVRCHDYYGDDDGGDDDDASYDYFQQRHLCYCQTFLREECHHLFSQSLLKLSYMPWCIANKALCHQPGEIKYKYMISITLLLIRIQI